MPLTPAAAVDQLAELFAHVARVYDAGLHTALGYDSWGAMIAKEVGVPGAVPADALMALMTTSRAARLSAAASAGVVQVQLVERERVLEERERVLEERETAPVTARCCARCGGPLPVGCRADRAHCSGRCRVAAHRSRASNT